MRRLFFLTCILFLGHSFSVTLNAQTSIADSVVLAGLVDVEYGAVLPAGDLADRFGFHSSLGFNVLIKNRQNTLWGFGSSFFFGNQIRTDSVVLDGLKNEDGFLLGTDGFLHNPLLLMRGFSFSFSAGKVITLNNKPNMNSGLVLLAGAGFMQHKIDIEAELEFLPQLNGDIVKGYDRLTNGLFLSQYIGFLALGENKFVNIRTGLEFREGITASRRSINADTGLMPQGNRFDMQIALKVAWVLPVYERPKVRYYTY